MKRKRLIPARFGPDTRFEIRPVPTAPFRALERSAFETLREELLQTQLGRHPRPDWNSRLRQASNEAAALAWTTSFPLLVFPELFEEKATNALLLASRQERILQRSRWLMAA